MILPFASSDQLRALARVHSIVIPRGVTRREQFLALLTSHSCESSCVSTVSWFSCATPVDRPACALPRERASGPISFPPVPTTLAQKADFITDWCTEISPDYIYESACAVCARFTPDSLLSSVPQDEIDLSPLERDDDRVTRVERLSCSETMRSHSGPILCKSGVRSVDGTSTLSICAPCLQVLRRGTLPRNALANGLWVGDTPSVLQGLSYVEQLVIAKSCHSFCVAQVARSGQRFLAANVIVFGQPTERVYNVLPPPREDIQQCLAILFVGSAKPTDEDVRRTPFLVRRNVVYRALQWLKLNNSLYECVEISTDISSLGNPLLPLVALAFLNFGAEKVLSA